MSERIEDRENGYVVVRRTGKEKLSDHVKIKEDNWSIASKNKLKASMRHKMNRIFVGILELLDKEKANGNIDRETGKRMRNRILGIGNDEVRSMETELDARYNIEALNYQIEFRNPPEGKGTHE